MHPAAQLRTRLRCAPFADIVQHLGQCQFTGPVMTSSQRALPSNLSCRCNPAPRARSAGRPVLVNIIAAHVGTSGAVVFRFRPGSVHQQAPCWFALARSLHWRADGRAPCPSA